MRIFASFVTVLLSACLTGGTGGTVRKAESYRSSILDSLYQYHKDSLSSLERTLISDFELMVELLSKYCNFKNTRIDKKLAYKVVQYLNQVIDNKNKMNLMEMLEGKIESPEKVLDVVKKEDMIEKLNDLKKEITDYEGCDYYQPSENFRSSLKILLEFITKGIIDVDSVLFIKLNLDDFKSKLEQLNYPEL